MATEAQFIGGPLDGQRVESSGGMWCAYRDENGQRVPTERGDREWLQRRYYTKQKIGRRLVYVHASVWDEWKSKYLAI